MQQLLSSSETYAIKEEGEFLGCRYNVVSKWKNDVIPEDCLVLELSDSKKCKQGAQVLQMILNGSFGETPTEIGRQLANRLMKSRLPATNHVC